MTTHNDHATFFGIYRAVVVDNADPLGRNRLRLTVPSVTGGVVLDWAWPCLPPVATVVTPAPGASVFVQYEGGDPNYPVWVGVSS